MTARANASARAPARARFARRGLCYASRMEAPPRNQGPFTVTPIGWVRSPYQERFGTPQQAEGGVAATDAVVEFDPARLPEAALRDLDGMDRIWLLTYLHLVDSWRPTVRPPRGPMVRRSVLATRSPHRPNPIGLSCVTLVGVQGTTLLVRGVDLLDGTPVLDVKPYLPYADAFPDARVGWIATIPDGAPQTGRAMGARHRRKQGTE